MLIAMVLSCTDEEKDPFLLADIKRAALIALRDGESDDNFFIKNAPSGFTGSETFSYTGEYLSEDQDNLQEIQLFALFKKQTRVSVGTVAGTAFVSAGAGLNRIGSVSIPLATVLSALNISGPAIVALGEFDISIETDIVLTDGSTIPSSSLVNSGLFESAIFFPVHDLIYAARDVSEFLPVATLSLSSTKPLLDGEKVTVTAKYDIDIATAPTITIDGAPAAVNTVNAKEFTAEFTATGNRTTSIQATASGAVAGGAPPIAGLVSLDKSINIVMDNAAPQLVGSVSTGGKIGRDQFRTISATFNEPLSTVAANALKITVTGQGLAPVTAQSMTISSNGLTATFNYVWTEASAGSATHGALTITFTGGKDAAGNAVNVAALDASASLISDLATPPAPTLTLDVQHDLGDQIKWSASTAGGGSPAGSNQGTVYFVAIDADEPAPLSFSFDADGLAVWEMATGVIKRQQGSRTVSGTAFTPFTANGTFDIYAVFVSDTGNTSDISANPQLEDVVMN